MQLHLMFHFLGLKIQKKIAIAISLKSVNIKAHI